MLIVTHKGRTQLPPGVDRTRLEVRVFSFHVPLFYFSVTSHSFSLFKTFFFAEAPVTWWIPGCVQNVHRGIWPPFSMEEKRPEEKSVSLLVVRENTVTSALRFGRHLQQKLQRKTKKGWGLGGEFEPAKKDNQWSSYSTCPIFYCSYLKQSYPNLWYPFTSPSHYAWTSAGLSSQVLFCVCLVKL